MQPKYWGKKDSVRKFGLERLGIPLIEIATEPFEVELTEIKKIALSLGRILTKYKESQERPRIDQTRCQRFH